MKKIFKIGVVFITVLISFAVFTYYFYFNQDDNCPEGTFLCKNDTKCIPQSRWCNGEFDCPDGDDEEFNCFDSNGYWDFIFDKIYLLHDNQLDKNKRNLSCPDDGTLNNYTDSCEYGMVDDLHDKYCSLKCHNVQLLPANYSLNISILTITNNNMISLPADYFLNYKNLLRLSINNSELTHFENDIFINQNKLKHLIIENSNLKKITKGNLVGLSTLDTISLPNNKIETFDLRDLENNRKLANIYLVKNHLTSSNLTFPNLPSLEELNLEDNRLEEISDNMFHKLTHLKSLNLESNFISYISPDAFRNLNQLQELLLNHNYLSIMLPACFTPLKALTRLFIGFNPVEKLSPSVFSGMKNLRSLNLEDIDIDHFELKFFNKFPLSFVHFKKFYYCSTYASNVKICTPQSDGVSSSTDLLGRPFLRISVWGIALATCLGNAVVLWGRFTAHDENRVLSLVIKNLAVADLLMGFYLIIIGLIDIKFRAMYNAKAFGWMSSWPCTIIGILAMTSCEVSVLILAFMSVERFMLIVAPLKGYRAMSAQTAASCMIILWTIGLSLAIFPVLHWRNSITRFYGVNGMCFPLHIDDPFIIGWEYSSFIFLGINFLGLMIIVFVYVGMFRSIWKTRHATTLSIGESEFALRFFLIVLTDAICWAPIIILKILALYKYPVSSDLIAWVVVFILPVNSAVNPLLYTLTTRKFRERLENGFFGKFRGAESRRASVNVHDVQVNNVRNVMFKYDKNDKIILPQNPLDNETSFIKNPLRKDF